MLSKEQLQGTSAEALVAERLGEIPVGQVAVFYHLVPQVPFGQWKIECDCSPVTGLHHAVASACEWSIAAFHPVMGAAGLKVYNVVPACRADGHFQDGICTVWIESTWNGKIDVLIMIFVASP